MRVPVSIVAQVWPLSKENGGKSICIPYGRDGGKAAWKAKDKIKSGIDKAAEKTKDAAGKAADKAQRGAEAAGDAMKKGGEKVKDAGDRL